MRIERRDLVDLGLGKAHLLGERREMGRREVAEAVLDQVQVLDQEIATPGPALEQRPDRLEGRGIDLAALGPCGAARLAPAGVAVLADLASGLIHAWISPAGASGRRPVPVPSVRRQRTRPARRGHRS